MVLQLLSVHKSIFIKFANDQQLKSNLKSFTILYKDPK